jgi:uncharacterized membrane protein YeaQ/YmgE (transglycosylase-associated protein family)
MSHFIWLLAVGLAGWASGEIVGGRGFGRVADILLGISGAFLVRFIMEQVGIPLGYVNLLLLSVWGAAAPPATVRLLVRRDSHSNAASQRTTAPSRLAGKLLEIIDNAFVWGETAISGRGTGLDRSPTEAHPAVQRRNRSTAGMSKHSSLDRESLQKLLADAFVVQESGIETRSLSALVELQGWVATGELDVDRALHLVADRARNVANATGIAIALLKGDQLVYRAGSGSSAACVGRHVTAVLSVSKHTQSRDEILRVENAQSDGRIEAAICRQFGARSLLILPIYDNRALVGVLEAIFGDAHTFQDREVRTYRLMAGLLGEAMSRAAHIKQKAAAAAEPPVVEQRIEKIAPQVQESLHEGGSRSVPAANPATGQTRRPPVVAAESPARRPLARAASIIMQRAKDMPSYKRWAVAAVLVLVSWIAYRDRGPASTLGASALQGLNAMGQPLPSVPAKTSASSMSTPQTAPVLTEEARKTARSMPRWVRVGNNELDYVAPEVTVRYFTATPAPRRVEVGPSHVEHIGDDVTVRYFTPTAAPPRVQAGANQIHYISEDMTVRSVMPKHATAPPALPAGDAGLPVDP